MISTGGGATTKCLSACCNFIDGYVEVFVHGVFSFGWSGRRPERGYFDHYLPAFLALFFAFISYPLLIFPLATWLNRMKVRRCSSPLKRRKIRMTSRFSRRLR